MKINQPHGYLRDEDNRVVMRFGNWTTGEHIVPTEVESVEYVDGPNAHEYPVDERYKSE